MLLHDVSGHVRQDRRQRHGVVRQTLRNWTMVLLELVGVHPNRLANWYAPHDRAVLKMEVARGE